MKASKDISKEIAAMLDSIGACGTRTEVTTIKADLPDGKRLSLKIEAPTLCIGSDRMSTKARHLKAFRDEAIRIFEKDAPKEYKRAK